MPISTQGLPFQKPERKRKKNRVRSKWTLKLAKMKWELDRLIKEEVFERDGYRCLRCGATNRELQPAHVLSRRHPCLRWDADNLMSLCGGCHLAWHHEPALAVEWFVKNFAERWSRIKNILLVNPKVSVREMWRERCGGSEAK